MGPAVINNKPVLSTAGPLTLYHMSSTILLPLREQLCHRSCNNQQGLHLGGIVPGTSRGELLSLRGTWVLLTSLRAALAVPQGWRCNKRYDDEGVGGRERVLFIGTRYSNLYTAVDRPTEASWLCASITSFNIYIYIYIYISSTFFSHHK
jgi:hypothetical protein